MLRTRLTLADVTVNGGQFYNAGDVYTTGTTTISAAITNDFSIDVSSGVLHLTGLITGIGSVQIDSGAELILDGSDSQTVSFGGANAELQINTATFDGTSRAWWRPIRSI